jgi:SAM-dependent methyltransferase
MARVIKPGYAARVKSEEALFSDNLDVHNLPEIFHYWSNKYLRPKINAFGFDGVDDFYEKQLIAVMGRVRSGTYRFISLGAGNCDAEVRIVQSLRKQGYENFVIECLDLNKEMLQRGRHLVQEKGCSEHIVPISGDFNHWRPRQPYHAVMANQSLHHVYNLEGLFDAIHEAIKPVQGALITSDVIGRNGHQRWPEALTVIEEIWDDLSDCYKYNHQLKRLEKKFVNWDCSTESFEGIRAQDILPLLVERFHFELFLPFANIIAPFIDRSFGHNFDANAESDRRLIDSIHARDEQEIFRGVTKPTQMFAVLVTEPCQTRCIEGLSPRQSVRHP